MNAPDRFVLPDIQSTPDHRRRAINRVGVKSIVHPLQVRAGGAFQHTVATIDMFVGLPGNVKGAHMSRFLEILQLRQAALDGPGLRALMAGMLERLQADSGSIDIRFSFFLSKRVPVSGVESLRDYRGRLRAEQSSQYGYGMSMEVTVPLTSLCPCSKQVSAHGAHNQRSHLTIAARVADDVQLEDLVRIATHPMHSLPGPDAMRRISEDMKDMQTDITKREDAAQRETIAVVGSGIAGLSAAWLLARHYSVTLFEAGDYLGGHTHTVEVTLDGVTAPVDTGFLVFNERTYPNLRALFETIGVSEATSDMSFSVRVDEARLEWAGSNLVTVFAQKRNLIKPEFWGMLKDILRFNRESTAIVHSGTGYPGSLGQFLTQRRYGRAFRDWYLLPMSGAIWSCPTRQMLDYPADTFFRFCHNHGLLQIADRPRWRTVAGGGREYVRRLAAGIGDIRLNCRVNSVTRNTDGVLLQHAGGAESFSQVVLACHSDQALALLDDAVDAEKRLLSRIGYQMNHAVLHTDASLLPRKRDAWAAWNYAAGNSGPDARPVSVSYYINMLQPLPFRRPVIVTLNPTHAPREDQVIERFEYAHPIFDSAAIEAQRELPAIQGRRRTWFCGAWTGYGFHEDGLKSGMTVANALGVRAPWQAQALAA